MALTVNPKITFNGKEATEGILEPAFDRPEISRIMDVRNGIKAKEQIAFLGRLTKVTKKDGGAGTGKQARSLAMSEKFWDPEQMKIWIALTEDEIEKTFYVWLTKNGVDRRNVEDLTQFYTQWVLEVFSEAALEDAVRIAYFGDKAIAAAADGGTLTNADEVENYNQIDGFFKQIQAGVTAGTVKRVAITANAAGTKALQLVLGATDAYDTYKALMNAADPRLRAAKDKVFLVTGTMFRNRIDEKESKAAGLESQVKRQDQFFSDDVYRNVPIIDMDTIWDRWILTDFDNGTTYEKPHRVILTTVSNLVAGYDAEGSVNDFRTYFDENSETVNLKGLYKFDAKLLQEFNTAIAW